MFPPTPLYPKAIDSNHTLFLVYNTTETKICIENPIWSQEIEIVPVKSDKLEIWADSGFGNISGELFYYGSVSKNTDGKVHRLKDCARNLGGEKTKWNKKGAWIRSYVVAEHHNQLVDVILKMQDFTGINFDVRPRTLDWRIRNLEALEVIFDDFACPDIDFTFNTTEVSKEAGILATYSVIISSAINATKFRLDFGDGEFTTTALSGTHRYAINSRIDPVITVSNDKCQIIQTPIERDNPAEPPPIIDDEFEIPIPQCEDIVDFVLVPCDVPPPDLTPPPLVLPCGESFSFSSDVTNFSQIVTVIDSIPSVIRIEGFSSYIYVDIPTLVIEPPPPITIIIVQSDIVIDVNALDMPDLRVDWGTPPEQMVQMAMVKQVKTAKMLNSNDLESSKFGIEFADLFEAQGKLQVQYEPVELPSEIHIIAPDLPKVTFDTSNIPQSIKVDASEVNIPTDIQIHGPESPIPTIINLVGEDIPSEIELVWRGDAIELKLSTEIPKSIKVELSSPIPDKIVVEVPEMKIDASEIPKTISLKGAETIELVVPDHIKIPVFFPDEMPTMEMVYKGSPIEIKISMDEIMSKDDDGKNCVRILPCSRN
jgi:hypothetical protein